MSLRVCAACALHYSTNELACPFCGAAPNPETANTQHVAPRVTAPVYGAPPPIGAQPSPSIPRWPFVVAILAVIAIAIALIARR